MNYVLLNKNPNKDIVICVSDDINKIFKSMCNDFKSDDDVPQFEIWENDERIDSVSGDGVLEKIITERDGKAIVLYDDDQEWVKEKIPCSYYVTYTHKKYSMLHKRVYDDGRIEYVDRNRFYCINTLLNNFCCPVYLSYVYDLDKEFPITFPYKVVPPNRKGISYTKNMIIVYLEAWNVRGERIPGSFDFQHSLAYELVDYLYFISHLKYPDGKIVYVNKYFMVRTRMIPEESITGKEISKKDYESITSMLSDRCKGDVVLTRNIFI